MKSIYSTVCLLFFGLSTGAYANNIQPAFSSEGGHSGNGGETRVGPAFYGIAGRLAKELPSYSIQDAISYPITIKPRMSKIRLDDATLVDANSYSETTESEILHITEIFQKEWSKKSCYDRHLLVLHEIFIHLGVEKSLSYPVSKPSIDELAKRGKIICPLSETDGMPQWDKEGGLHDLKSMADLPQGTSLILNKHVQIQPGETAVTFNSSDKPEHLRALSDWLAVEVSREFIGCWFDVSPSPRRRFVESGLILTVKQVVPNGSGELRIKFYESSLGDLRCSGVHYENEPYSSYWARVNRRGVKRTWTALKKNFELFLPAPERY